MKHRAFTIVELMVSIAVTALLVIVLVNVANTTSNAWLRGEAQAESFANARGSINLLARELKGAVVDLDLGLSVRTVPAETNNFVLKFLSRTEPSKEEITPVRKIAYQLAWATTGMVPEISPGYDETHKNPVLVRTVSTDLTKVFEVKAAGDDGKWVENWGNIADSAVRAGELVAGTDELAATTSSDIAAENIVGWQVASFFWDRGAGKMILDEVGAANSKYDKYLRSNDAPRALQIKMAAVSSRAANQLASRFPSEWSNIRSLDGLFEQEKLPNTPFGDALRQNLTYFDATINLSSKTP